MSRRLGIASVVLLVASAALAQNSRSAVSVTGSDLNGCTVIAPCRSFSVAMSHTSAAGEIIALTSGGYGPFTVDRSVSVVAAPGSYAGVTATSGNGIVINAGAGGKVTLRNLYINGGGTGDTGVAVTMSGDETSIENCVISGFVNYALIAFLNVRVIDTTIRTCGYGAWIDNAGATVKGSLDHVRMADIHGGGDAHGTGIGIFCFRNATVGVRDTVVTDSETAIRVDSGSLIAENCLLADSSAGVHVGSGTARMTNNVVSGNINGWLIDPGAVLETFDNNRVAGNAINITNAGVMTHISLN